MRIAIVDDLAAERALLKDRLEQQLHRRNVQADILEYDSGETYPESFGIPPWIRGASSPPSDQHRQLKHRRINHPGQCDAKGAGSCNLYVG